VDKLEKVLEKLGTTESTTLAFKREEVGKIRVASLLWETPKVILRGEVPEVRNSLSRRAASARTSNASPNTSRTGRNGRSTSCALAAPSAEAALRCNVIVSHSSPAHDRGLWTRAHTWEIHARGTAPRAFLFEVRCILGAAHPDAVIGKVLGTCWKRYLRNSAPRKARR
jgi:hypothetical protein